MQMEQPSIRAMSKTATRFWIAVGVVGIAIHVVFCVQAYIPLRHGGMASNGPWLLIFFPHYMLDFFLPPPDPIISIGTGPVQVNYFYFWGKMIVAFPASLAYALLLAGIGTALMRYFRHDRPA